MNIKQGNLLLLSLTKKYISDENVLNEIEKIVFSPPPRVAIRGIYEIIMENKTADISKEDGEAFDDLFYFFG